MIAKSMDTKPNITTYAGLDSFDGDTLEKELALFKKRGFNTEKLKQFNYNALQLSEIRKGLEDDVDVNKFLDPKLSWLEMEEIRLELVQGIDMSSYREQGFDSQQIYQIRKGIASGIDVSVYAKKEFLPAQMKQIRKGLTVSEDFPIIFYLDPAFDSLQMREIRKGLEAEIDVSTYAHVDMPYMKMRVIRESAEDGLVFSEEKVKEYGDGILNQLHLAFKENIDLSGYITNGFDADQLEEIRIALNEKLPINKFISLDMRGDAIREVRYGLEHGIAVEQYAHAQYNWQQMQEMRLGLEHQIDVSSFSSPLYWADQMREIRIGLEEGLDTSVYSSMMYTAKDMRRMRQNLLLGVYDEDEGDDGLAMEISDSKSQKLLVKMLDHKDDYLSFTHGKMLCWLTLPENENLKGLNEEVLYGFLFRNKIRNGIDQTMLRKIAADPKPGEKYLVAAGVDAVDGQDGYYEYFFSGAEGGGISETEDGELDISRIDEFMMVNIGEVVAKYHRSTKGKDGCDVFGKVVVAKKGKEIPVLQGEGFMVLNDRVSYVAKYKGILKIEDGKIFIRKMMVMPEVRITDKIVRYEGTVIVKGDVFSGSEIRATGDVIISGHMESSTIVSGGNVVVKGGATCPVRGGIDAKGDVSGKFFEGVSINANNVYANSFVNCNVVAKGLVKTYGNDGVIYGGTIKSLTGVECATVGSKAGAKTIVSVGFIDNVLSDYHIANSDLARDKEELKILEKEKEKLQDIGTVTREILQLKIKINAAVGIKEKTIKETEEKIAAMQDTIQKGNRAKVYITHMAYNGVIFVICGVIHKIENSDKLIMPMTVKVDAKRENIVIL